MPSFHSPHRGDKNSHLSKLFPTAFIKRVQEGGQLQNLVLIKATVLPVRGAGPRQKCSSLRKGHSRVYESNYTHGGI